MTRAERQAARLALGRDAVMAPEMAAELLPFGDGIAREWLREQGLVRTRPQLGRFVIWGEVLDALVADPPGPETAPRPATGYPRADLRRKRG